ncbi:MAG: leucine-rich repeat protein [Methanomassiliicoccaceae archaeon]|nr:leucine-rich repeat protein [Methanomassiliicoccaceae archaeon]
MTKSKEKLKGRPYAALAVITAAIMFAGAFAFVAAQSGEDQNDVPLGADAGRLLYNHEMVVVGGVLTGITGGTVLNGAMIVPLTFIPDISKPLETVPITEIGDEAFKGQDKMTKIVLQSNIERIGERAFSGCTMLNEAVIGAGVGFVGDDAFIGCGALDIVCLEKRSSEPGSFKSSELKFGKDVFQKPVSITYDYKDSSVFNGWFYTDLVGASKPLPGSSIPGGAFDLNGKTIYALWMDAYNVAFYSGLEDDEVPVTGSEPVVKGRTFNPFMLFMEYEGNFVLDGYTLVGWRVIGGSDTIYGNSNIFTMPTDDVDFVAVWEPIPEPADNTYTTSALAIGVLAVGILFALAITGRK